MKNFMKKVFGTGIGKKSLGKRSGCLLLSFLISLTALCGCGNSAADKDAAAYEQDGAETDIYDGADADLTPSAESEPNTAVIEEAEEGGQIAETPASDAAGRSNEYSGGVEKAEAENKLTDSVIAYDYACQKEPYYEKEPYYYDDSYYGENTEEYNEINEAGFQSVSINPLSTFSADVDTASYSNLRRMIEDGYTVEDIPDGAVRIEELLNYFDYDYAGPQKGEPFGVTTRITDCPWNENTKIAMIGLKTKGVDFSEAAPSNLVFLLDVSGSMYSEDKLPLLQRSFSLLTENLTSKDRVSIVTYASGDRVLMEGVSGSEHDEILGAVNSLEAGGSTYGSAGITTAYNIAEKYFIKGGNNRVILATDGDLNVGLTTQEELEELITKEKESGVYLSVLGFGSGNIKDNKMETLADKGNGNYSYIDSLSEAKKVLVEEMGATLVTVAEDVKLQVEFNPEVVTGYRLIGYENRQLAEQDFDDDTKDAGEIGAGHTVTALYEIVTADTSVSSSGTDLKYGAKKSRLPDEEWFTVSIRYKNPGSASSRKLSYPADKNNYKKTPNEDMKFAMAVAEFGLTVNDSSYKGSASLHSVIENLDEIDTGDDEYKDEFCYLVKKLERNAYNGAAGWD